MPSTKIAAKGSAMTDINDSENGGPAKGTGFQSLGEFHVHLKEIFARAQHSLLMFDPDFSLWPLQRKEGVDLLREFLLGNPKAEIKIVTHRAKFLEKECPHFLLLLRDFSHAISCRETHKGIKHLSDSFCIADQLHVVRRFHCDGMRGAAEFDSHQNVAVPLERFAQIWDESDPCLRSTILGL